MGCDIVLPAGLPVPNHQRRNRRSTVGCHGLRLVQEPAVDLQIAFLTGRHLEYFDGGGAQYVVEDRSPLTGTICN